MKRILCLFLCLVLAAAPLGCKKEESSPPSSAPSVSEPTQGSQYPAAEIYAQAKNAVLSLPNRIITYTITRTRTVHTQTFTEKVTGSASFSNIGGENFDAIIEEDLIYGGYSGKYTESYCEGSAFCTTGDRSFSVPMSPADFIARHPALPDETLYTSGSAQNVGGQIHFTFTEPSAPESWAIREDVTQFSATATAALDAQGILTSAGYSARYTLGQISYVLDVMLRITTPQELDLSVLHPDHTQGCIQVQSLDGPKFLLRCVGDLFASQAISSHATERIVSEAVPITQVITSDYHLTGSGGAFASAISHTTDYRDYRNESMISQEKMVFLGGVCTVTGKDGITTPNPDLTANDMRMQVEDAILSAVFAPQYISNITLAEDGDAYHFTFTGNESYCSDLYAMLESFLGVDLDGTADSYEDARADGYLTVDKQTMLPTAIGMGFSRVHRFGKIKYALNYELTHILDLASTDAAGNITQ